MREFDPVDFQLPRDPTERTEPHGDGLRILAFDEAVPLEYIGGRFLSLEGSLDDPLDGFKLVRFLEIRLCRLLSRDESRDLDGIWFWAADLPR